MIALGRNLPATDETGDTHNPYQPPSIAVAEEPDSSLIPSPDVLRRHLAENNFVGWVVILLSLGGMCSAVTMAFYTIFILGAMWKVASAYLLPFGIAELIFLTGVYQRKHLLRAITVNSVLAAALLVATAFFIVFVARKTLAQGAIDWLGAALLLGAAALACAAIIPIRVAVRAWRWHLQGIDPIQMRNELAIVRSEAAQPRPN